MSFRSNACVKKSPAEKPWNFHLENSTEMNDEILLSVLEYIVCYGSFRSASKETGITDAIMALGRRQRRDPSTPTAAATTTTTDGQE